MNIKRTWMILVLAVIASVSFGALAVLAAPIDDEIDALQTKFEQRYPQLRQLKKSGTIGETSEGFVDFVESMDPNAREIVDEENADRRKLYGLIAQKEETTPEKVAERNARRNFRKAQDGEMLREKDGTWREKKSD